MQVEADKTTIACLRKPGAGLTALRIGREDAGRGSVLERKLAAILCADVYGYSRLMGEDEEATHRTLISHRKIIDSLIEQHHGRFVNSAGDSVLAEFASVVNAVQCAVDVQTALKARKRELLPERRMEFRIGVNLGDVMVDGDQIYGDGVNVAARLESLAEPGGICVSRTVHEQIRNKLRTKLRGPRRANGQEYRRARARLPGTAQTVPFPRDDDAAGSTQLLARRRILVGRAGDNRRDSRAGPARIAQSAAH